MALDKDQVYDIPGMRLDVQPEERVANDLYDRDTGRSNFVAFLLGGVVIAGGLLAFLYYDSDNLASRDVPTTGSIGRMETAAPTLQPRTPMPKAP